MTTSEGLGCCQAFGGRKMTRTFEDKFATRERVPMLVGLVGPSGSGKTKSALRLAEGMVRVTGGEVFVIDTEARRALHYADEHEFRHIEMGAPFSSLDYMAAIEHCVKKKAGVLVIDSASHEHEGPGGFLETHEAELDRMAGSDYAKRQRVKFSAWIKPKAQRRKLINEVLRLGVNAIFCFRAKEKIKIVKGEDPISLGWQPISGDEFVYEMTVNCLLYPRSNGVPNWAPNEPGEKIMLKLPEHLEGVFKNKGPLSEDTGEALAKWAEGDGKDSPDLEAAVVEFGKCESTDEVEAVRARFGKRKWTASETQKLKAAVIQARERVVNSTPEHIPCPAEDATGAKCVIEGPHDNHQNREGIWEVGESE